MSGNRQMEVHYINTGFPYTVTESFMDLFEGLTYAEADATIAGARHDQGTTFWEATYANSYKYGFPGSSTDLYYDFSHTTEIHDYTHRFVEERRSWDNPVVFSNLDLTHQTRQGNEFARTNRNLRAEECIQAQHNANGSQVFLYEIKVNYIILGCCNGSKNMTSVSTEHLLLLNAKLLEIYSAPFPASCKCYTMNIWQDNIDPDSMTYEELLELGESVGTQSRGLTQERIASLPVTKYKCSFFSRKKAQRERCVICQMEYKRGDRQITLSCKHAYHPACVTRWLAINKACPICFVEVSADEPKNQ